MSNQIWRSIKQLETTLLCNLFLIIDVCGCFKHSVAEPTPPGLPNLVTATPASALAPATDTNLSKILTQTLKCLVNKTSQNI